VKETIGLITQAIALWLLIFVVIRRQLNDLGIKEDDPRTQYTKNALFAGALLMTLLCSMGFVRLLHIFIVGGSTPLLDDMTFWANRLVYLAAGVTGWILYRGNKRQI
jgi:hypothetical protein